MKLAVAVKVRRLRFGVTRDHLGVRGVPVDNHAAQEDKLMYAFSLRFRRDFGRQIGVYLVVQVFHALVRRDVGDPGCVQDHIVPFERLFFPLPVSHADRVDLDRVCMFLFNPPLERIADITVGTGDQYFLHLSSSSQKITTVPAPGHESVVNRYVYSTIFRYEIGSNPRI